jgi:polar amino acid transport system permease protein
MNLDFQSWPEWAHELLPGLKISAQLLVGVVLLGSLLALVLSRARASRHVLVRAVSIVVMEIGRGFPALVGLYLVYYGLPSAGLTLGSFTAATIALSVNFAGYTSDVLRAGFEAVPTGQVEASQALGLPRRTEFFRIVLPQATHVFLPPMLSWVVIYFQATSLAFAISVPEIMSSAYQIASNEYKYLDLFLVAGLLYAVICIPMSKLVNFLEGRNQGGTAY